MHTRRLFIVAAALAPALPALAQPSFTGIGDLGDGTLGSKAYSVSRDGLAVVGYSGTPSGYLAVRWTAMDGISGLGSLLGGGNSQSNGISATGRYAVGVTDSSSGRQAYVWSLAGGMIGLGDLPGGIFSSYGGAVLPDGRTVLGIADYDESTIPYKGQAFVWTKAGGMKGLGFLKAGDIFSEADAASDDGSIIVGTSGNGDDIYRAYRWTAAGGMVALGTIPGGADNNSGAYDITPDGKVIVGHAAAPGGGYEAFRWTKETGMVGLGDLAGDTVASIAQGVSADGAVIVGRGNADSAPEAIVWDSAHGMRSIKTVLETDYGLDLTGWTLSIAWSVSGDGKTIVGEGTNPSGYREGWVARLDSKTCYPDCNGDGKLNVNDFICFQAKWRAGCP